MLRLGSLFSSAAAGVDAGSLFLSPMWTAVLCCVVIMLIIYLVMSKEVEPVFNDTSFLVLVFKVGLWVFVSQVIVLYLSQSAVERKISMEYKNKNQERIVDRVLVDDIPSPN
jgi:hypothetical protein